MSRKRITASHGKSARKPLSTSSDRSDVRRLVAFVQQALQKAANPTKAGAMARYMKTGMPFYGVPRPDLRLIERAMRKQFVHATQREYASNVRALWALPHREEKYLAISLARAGKSFITPASMSLYEQMIREGAWWDFVDEIAAHLVGKVLLDHRKATRPVLDRWIDDDEMWIRRTAILSQLTHKYQTDERQLFDYCRSRMDETEFFIRKAIGWALRQYSYTAPDAVRKFLLKHRDRLSGLSYREGAKQLVRTGKMKA